MFNLKSKTKQMVREIKSSLEPVRDPNEVIAEIHNEFDTVTERLLLEAKDILSGIKDTGKGERLKALGFAKSKSVIEAESEIEKRKKNKYIAECIEYYSFYYPNNKFITEEKVEEICKKYGLIFGNVYFYKGDVPEKNIKEIESFTLREEDYSKYEVFDINKKDDNGNPIKVYVDVDVWGRHKHTVTDKSAGSFINKKQEFKICASISDFNTRDMNIKDGYKLEYNLPDPIVLQPVNGGYLIVSKWGLEADDKDLINEVLN